MTIHHFEVGDKVWSKSQKLGGEVFQVDESCVDGYGRHCVAWDGGGSLWFGHEVEDLVPRPEKTEPIDTGVNQLVYIAGPMRGYKEFNFPAFDRARDHLLEAGWFSWSPADHDRTEGFDVTGLTGNEDLADLGFDLRKALAKDMEIIATEASAVAVLPGWEKSSGARAEVALAHALGLPVAEYDAFGKAGIIWEKIYPTLPPSTNAPKLPLIGITGQKRTGKDTLGEEFVKLGYKRVGLADPIKEFAEALNPYLFNHGHKLNYTVESRGWEAAKDEVPEVRTLLQKLGTEAGRTILGDNVWVDAAMKRVAETDGPVVITDVRFDNEAQAILDAGGIVIRVTRPGIGNSGDTHASEAGIKRTLVTHDYVNDGSLEDIAAWVGRLARG